MKMKKTLLAALAGIVLATSASASPIDGKWACHENMDRNGLKGTIRSSVDFRPDGLFLAAMAMDLRKLVVPIKVVLLYQANWTYRDGKLFETPKSVRIDSFTVVGADMMGGDMAKELEADLMRTDGVPPDVVVISENNFELRQPGRVVSCTR